MEVFLYEFVTGGGLLESGEIPRGSLLTEGSAMVRALADDLNRVDGSHVIRMQDARIKFPTCGRELVHVVDEASQELSQFFELSQNADWTIVIAPEINGALQRRIGAVNQAGGRLLGGSREFVDLASNKHHTMEHLEAAGIPVPAGFYLPAGSRAPEIRHPTVMKPVDGAGSWGVRLVQRDDELVGGPIDRDSRFERYCEGLPVSVGFFTGPSGWVPLLPSRQHVAPPDFLYLGGSLPLPAPLAARAMRLADSALAALPRCLGYAGVDLVLGSEASGSQDVVVEVNPRLTTSYVGLRRAARDNLAQVMLETAEGKMTSEIAFESDPIDFSADGAVR